VRTYGGVLQLILILVCNFVPVFVCHVKRLDRSRGLSLISGRGSRDSPMARQLPPLREISLSDILNKAPPIPKIKTEEDVELWKTTRSYSDLGLFLQKLNKAVVGHYLPFTPQHPSQVNRSILPILKVLTDPWLLACGCCSCNSRRAGYMDRRSPAVTNTPKVWKPCV